MVVTEAGSSAGFRSDLPNDRPLTIERLRGMMD